MRRERAESQFASSLLRGGGNTESNFQDRWSRSRDLRVEKPPWLLIVMRHFVLWTRVGLLGVQSRNNLKVFQIERVKTGSTREGHGGDKAIWDAEPGG